MRKLSVFVLLVGLKWVSSIGFPWCPPGFVPVRKPEGFKCLRDFRHKWSRSRKDFSKAERLDRPSGEHKVCLSKAEIYWAGRGKRSSPGGCYQLLTRGPCGTNEWFVLTSGNALKAHCEPRPCPCLENDVQMCEVLTNDNATTCRGRTEEGRCQDALAAEQRGICHAGEQLMMDPLGRGICACRIHPEVHSRWRPDGKCHPLFSSRGPCPRGRLLEFGHVEGEAVCVPQLCPNNHVLHHDGRCYRLRTRGPCDDHSNFLVDRNTLQPACTKNRSGNGVRDVMVDQNNCQATERGRCSLPQAGTERSRSDNPRKQLPNKNGKLNPFKFWRWLRMFDDRHLTFI